jgi:hypothetical protein
VRRALTANRPRAQIAPPRSVGTWRSLVAYLNGVQGVAGSNPAVPTNVAAGLASLRSSLPRREPPPLGYRAETFRVAPARLGFSPRRSGAPRSRLIPLTKSHHRRANASCRERLNRQAGFEPAGGSQRGSLRGTAGRQVERPSDSLEGTGHPVGEADRAKRVPGEAPLDLNDCSPQGGGWRDRRKAAARWGNGLADAVKIRQVILWTEPDPSDQPLRASVRSNPRRDRLPACGFFRPASRRFP